MRSTSRYFAMVRRAMFTPFSFKVAAISWSERGFAESSSAIIVAIMSWTLLFDTWVPSCILIPGVKKYFISNMPDGVFMYLEATARLTVVSCTPTAAATSAMVIGFRWAMPLSRNSTWLFTISCAMR